MAFIRRVDSVQTALAIYRSQLAHRYLFVPTGMSREPGDYVEVTLVIAQTTGRVKMGGLVREVLDDAGAASRDLGESGGLVVDINLDPVADALRTLLKGGTPDPVELPPPPQKAVESPPPSATKDDDGLGLLDGPEEAASEVLEEASQGEDGGGFALLDLDAAGDDGAVDLDALAPDPQPSASEAAEAEADPIDDPQTKDPATLAGPSYYKLIQGDWACRTCTKRWGDMRKKDGPEPGLRTVACSTCDGQLERGQFTPPRRFVEELPGALLYPARGTGLIIVFGVAILEIFASMAGIWGIMMRLFLFFYCAAYALDITNHTVTGKDELPDMPTPGGDEAGQGFLVVTTTVLCYGPAVACLLFAPPGIDLAGFFILLIAATIYWPMALLAVALVRRWGAVTPMLVLPAIRAVPGDYVIALLVLFGVEVCFGLIQAFLYTSFFGSMLAVVVGYYGWFVTMRLLGLLYRANRRTLGWFGEDESFV